MELPKNITQIGEANPHCKIYVEDYVVSYIKQMNQYAGEKELAVALYGIRKEEGEITYIFLYGACKLVFLQRECRHLSQAVWQEVEKQRKKYFSQYTFLGYRLLNGEMIEGFHICEQSVCRYVEGYARFYEKNDSMLAFMLEERREEVQPEKVDQEKYDMVRKRQEERRSQADESGGHAFPRRRKNIIRDTLLPEEGDGHAFPGKQKPFFGEKTVPGEAGIRQGRTRLTAAAAFVLLCGIGLAAVGGEGFGNLRLTVEQMMDSLTQRQLPDAVEAVNGSAQVGTVVAEEKLTDAVLKENAAACTKENQENGQGSGQEESSSEAEETGNSASGQETPPETQQGSGGSGQETPPESQQGSGGNGQETPPETQQGSGENGQETPPETQQGSGGSGQGTPPETQSGSDGSGQQDPAQQTDTKPSAELVSYTVQKGDTLIGICIRQYGSDARVAEICSLNNITNPDDIKEGEKIFIPQ